MCLDTGKLEKVEEGICFFSKEELEKKGFMYCFEFNTPHTSNLHIFREKETDKYCFFEKHGNTYLRYKNH